MAKFEDTITMVALILLSISSAAVSREFAYEPSSANAITGDDPYYTGIFDITVFADEPSYAEGPNEYIIDQVVNKNNDYPVSAGFVINDSILGLGLGFINPFAWISSIGDFVKNYLTDE
ncbi:hypothetical protein DsansV1_C06g0061561 [Dioscorea sansibarensis]